MQTDTATAAVAENDSNTDLTNTVPTQKRKVGRPPNAPNTMLAKAKALFPDLVKQNLDRSEILDTFEKVLDCTRGTAQVYYHECKKASGLSVTRKPKSAKAPVADTLADAAQALQDGSSADADAENAG